jgi:hypothetical protein
LTKPLKHHRPFRAGMYLLETLSAGMYNEPLTIYREYIQNAVDSIDLIGTSKRHVEIDVDPVQRRIRILDEGAGIPSRVAESILSSIGISEKSDSHLRGFRGIGRLGGLAFCDKAIYRTKAEGENVESIQEWDCKKLKRCLSDHKTHSVTLEKIFSDVTSFHKNNSRKARGSYFEVTLEGVSSFRNHILDVQRVRKYLSVVAPVPFDYHSFSHGETIDRHLSQRLTKYGTYSILLNGDPIHKPYTNHVQVSDKRKYDPITAINLIELGAANDRIASGWYAERRDFLGAVNRRSGVSGIRVRVGNILLGDSHLLDGCFREPRFNSYMVGEIHTEHPDLLPNSRRDDFIDNRLKGVFYDEVEKEIGIPASKQIRMRSRLHSEELAKKRSEMVTERNDVKQHVSSGTEGTIRNQRQRKVQFENLLINLLNKKILGKCYGCASLTELVSELQKAFKAQ